MSKFMEKYRTELMFALAALAILYWVSTMSPTAGKSTCGKKRKQVEFMEEPKTESLGKQGLSMDGMDNKLGAIDFESKGPVLGTECAGSGAAFVSSELLPKSNPNDKFNDFSPDLKGMNMLDTSDFIGIDTTTNTLRNANYSIRSEPPNPRQPVSPWMNSTIAPDLTRLKLDM